MPKGVRIPVVVGGTIPQADVAALRELGVAAVYPVGTGLHDGRRRRARAGLAGAGRSRERGPRRSTTDAGIPVREVYTEDDLAPGLAERLGAPGQPPFTRGPYPTMYRGQLWTMRQFAGFGSPEEANERFHFLLERGQTALSVAFDLPTQLGYDSGHPVARPEVGRVGVAIDTADDMVDLFAGLPLDRGLGELHDQRHGADHPGDVPRRRGAPGRVRWTRSPARCRTTS